MRRSTDVDPTWLVVLLFGGLALVSWLSEQPTWLQLPMLLSAAAAGSGWWTLFRMPTTCNVANRTSPRGCKSNVRGLLSACHRVDHQRRKRKLIWARLLGRPSPPSPYVSPAQAPLSGTPATAQPVLVQYHVEGAGYRATMLGCTIASTIVALVTGTITVVGLIPGLPI